MHRQAFPGKNISNNQESAHYYCHRRSTSATENQMEGLKPLELLAGDITQLHPRDHSQKVGIGSEKYGK